MSDGPAAPSGASALAPGDIIRLDDRAVVYLDQTRLPHEVVLARAETWPEVAAAIARLAVRGAPLIGIAGAMGVALAAATAPADLDAAAAALRRARPTAVNLAWAVDRMLAVAATASPDGLAERLAAEARAIHAEEVARCEAIGAHGQALIGRGARVLTHCNAGALATGGYGTALGVVRAAFARDPTLRVLVDETRPLLQGARLTAWELARDGIPHTLICDGMAASMMAAGRVTHVVVGADRIAANGDVANKIGTYGLAIVAREHGVPVIVAAPSSTLDLACPTGAAIPIEERPADEVRAFGGRLAAPPATVVANPAFDVTPARLVAAIVTERGVHRPPFERTLTT